MSVWEITIENIFCRGCQQIIWPEWYSRIKDSSSILWKNLTILSITRVTTCCLFSDYSCQIHTMVLVGTLLVVTQIIQSYFSFSFNYCSTTNYSSILCILQREVRFTKSILFKLVIKHFHMFRWFHFNEHITLKILRKNKLNKRQIHNKDSTSS